MPAEHSNPQDLTIRYDHEDWLKFQAWLEKAIPKSVKSNQDHFLVNLIIWAFIAAGAMWLFRQTSHFHLPSAAYTTALCGLMFYAYIRYMMRLRKAFAPSEHGSFLGTHHFSFNDEGIQTEGRNYRCHHQWSAIQRLERDNGLIMLFVDTANALILPEHKLQDPDALFGYLKAHVRSDNPT